MYQFAAERYTKCCFTLFDLTGWALALEEPQERSEGLQGIKAGFLELADLCKSMGLDCLEMVNRISETIQTEPDAKSAEHLIEEVKHALLKAFRGRSCWIMTPEETALFTSTPSTRIGGRFEESAGHLTDATHCLALGKSKASVYHAMCALEAPLGAMARYFSLPFDTASWGTIIGNIKDKLDRISRNAKASKKKKDVLQFYGEAAKEFAYFNEAWRIHAMHGRGAYDPNNARSIYEHVRHFTDHLATRLSSRSRAKCRL